MALWRRGSGDLQELVSSEVFITRSKVQIQKVGATVSHTPNGLCPRTKMGLRLHSSVSHRVAFAILLLNAHLLLTFVNLTSQIYRLFCSGRALTEECTHAWPLPSLIPNGIKFTDPSVRVFEL